MNAIGNPAGPSHAAFQQSAHHPVVFAGTVGLYKPADPLPENAASDAAVLFVGSWGFEELCARKFWLLLANDLSRRGLSSMRFDFPGTGDALDPESDDTGLDLWLDGIRAAAEKLRELSGVRHILLVGHGLGALLAWKAAETLRNVAGLALLAPALSGRHWLREFVTLSRIANPEALQHRQPASVPAMGEQILPDAIAAALRNINISTATSAPAPNVFVLKQENRPADEEFAQRLVGFDVETRAEFFPDYNTFVRDILFSVPSQDAIALLAEWACEAAAKFPRDSEASETSSRPQVPAAGTLTALDFCETPVRFGDCERLYGVLCEPFGPPQGATVIVVSTGYERMSGWGRITARLCRDLARSGIPSLRFDMANVADSPTRSGAPEQVLYHQGQVADISAAIDFLKMRGRLPVIVTGRCSGGWSAFKSAVDDARVSGVMPVNVFDLYIAEDVDVDSLLVSSRQPLSRYGSKLMSGGFWKRVWRGEVRIWSGIRNLCMVLASKAFAFLTPLMVKYPKFSKRLRALSHDFRTIAANDTRVTLLYSEGDSGAATLEASFGHRGRLLGKNYGSPQIAFIKDADHNLTTAEGRQAWASELKIMATRLAPRS